MPQFSPVSLQRLRTCDNRLQRVFSEVVKHFDCAILEGHRGREAQDVAFASGKSKVKWPDGKHNKLPSLAVDAAPYPVEFPLKTDSPEVKYKKLARFHYFAGFVMATASHMGIILRHGGDWDMDTDLKDNQWDDLPHFEIRE